MKKSISAILAAALTLSALTCMPASAEKYGDGKKIVVFGDSIAAGTSLSEGEYNYGQLCADYLKGSVENYAVSGYDTEDLIAQLGSLDKDQTAAVKDADLFLISIGGNDIAQYAIKYILDFAASANLLKEGYTADDVPEEPTFNDLNKLVDRAALSSYAKGSIANQRALNNMLVRLTANLRLVSTDKNADKYPRVIETSVIPNIQKICDTIKEMNPDAEIIIQNIYDPLQLDENFIKTSYSSYADVLEQFEPSVEKILASFSSQLDGVEGIKTADVYGTFTSKDEPSLYGCAYYFDNMQNKNTDIHPNQAGHVAIASTLLNVIGEDHKYESNLLTSAFAKLGDIENYPVNAYETYLEAAGLIPGDVNLDGFVNSSDATLILTDYSSVSTGGSNVITERLRDTADINKDKKIDSSDATSVLVYYSYLSTGGKENSYNYFNSNKK